MATLQVKGIDNDLYRALAARAAQERRSISQHVTRIIEDDLSGPRRSAAEATAALLELCGTWEDTRSPEEIIADIRTSRGSRSRVIAELE